MRDVRHPCKRVTGIYHSRTWTLRNFVVHAAECKFEPGNPSSSHLGSLGVPHSFWRRTTAEGWVERHPYPHVEGRWSSLVAAGHVSFPSFGWLLDLCSRTDLHASPPR